MTVTPNTTSPAAGRASAPPPSRRRRVDSRRAVDLAIAVPSYVVTLPFVARRARRAKRETGHVYERTQIAGRDGATVEHVTFAGSAAGGRLAGLRQVIRGDLALVGPHAVTPEEAADLDPIRFTVRPGLWPIGAASAVVGSSFDEAGAERAFVEGRRSYFGLVLRTVLARFLAGPPRPEPESLDLLGIRIANLTMEEAVDWIIERAGQDVPSLVCFVNPDCLNLASDDPEYRDILLSADLVLADGIGLRVAARLRKVGVRGNVNGTDLFPLLCERLAAASGPELYFLGAKPGVADKAALEVGKRFPGLPVAGIHHGYLRRRSDEAIVDDINESGARILLVGMGAPAQERWLVERRDALTVPVSMGVGGLFDYYSGNIPRAPRWMREVGMEWAWRLIQEPARMWRRYLVGNWVFLARVLKEQRDL